MGVVTRTILKFTDLTGLQWCLQAPLQEYSFQWKWVGRDPQRPDSMDRDCTLFVYDICRDQPAEAALDTRVGKKAAL